MPKRVLLTGGAGFVGSHLADRLLATGNRVRVLDNLAEQVHGPSRARPSYLDPEVELQIGDVRERESVDRALADVDAVVHLAASVGVGQSMYRIADYLDSNCVGTGTLLEAIAERRDRIERLVIASSMSIYGEGLYLRPESKPEVGEGPGAKRHDAGPSGNAHVVGARRDLARVRAGEFDPCDERGRPLIPTATPETKTPALESVYALSKYAQEQLGLLFGASYGVPTVALRFFNIYGTRQALSNPYTGVLAIFAARLLNDRPPLIYEDGHQRRDFVSVADVARACELALDHPDAVGQVFNIGSGKPRSIRQVALELAAVLGKPQLRPEITREVRVGDIRHCYADIHKAETLLGFSPEVEFADGLVELAGWLEQLDRRSTVDRVGFAREELTRRGLA
jgi:dTDP-L-rhamnose 4-epimerase